MIVDLISKSAKYIKRHLEYKSLDKNVPFWAKIQSIWKP